MTCFILKYRSIEILQYKTYKRIKYKKFKYGKNIFRKIRYSVHRKTKRHNFALKKSKKKA